MPERATGYEPATDERRERAVLVGVERVGDARPYAWDIEEDLAELARLADTAGLEVVGTVTQRLARPEAKTFIGTGKAEEVARLAKERNAGVVVLDEELTPSQQANLERLLPDVRVIDRTALILDIFAQHAVSYEGKLQVELARLEYQLPRLKGMWEHLERERLGGGRGARFGAGESQLETDRRLTRKRIAELKREIASIARHRETQRRARVGSGVFRIALVGYTNAGKSTVLNALTDAGVLVEDKLFATLDATTRRLELPMGREATITDTVGFINKLPHGLVESFRSTLLEAREADLQLHIVDASSPHAAARVTAVNEVLTEIGANERRQVLVFNKCDLLSAESRARLAAAWPNAVFIAAATGEGIDRLVERLAQEAARLDEPIKVTLPFSRGDLVSAVHERGTVVSEEHTPDGTVIIARVPHDLAARLEPFRRSEAEQG
ncbi:GTPase HflX [Coriobacteriia bacterium Es71-Z0120]|uniref:GTPase HflX n=1 Tax=Parvivirga hydrogeniphila TaxID=2939460 RepID=UPI002260C634|nr:GTPase HflX [Parvivirga hydrogeniphila]MCL4079631.1 GTPase HflX [Parvivirga hydrogeniphila]